MYIFFLFFLDSLEVWYFMALVLFAGYLKNAEVAVDALSIWWVTTLWSSLISKSTILNIQPHKLKKKKTKTSFVFF